MIKDELEDSLDRQFKEIVRKEKIKEQSRENAINHEELLKKYIELVCICEGCSFISDACEAMGFSKEEQEELIRLAEVKSQ